MSRMIALVGLMSLALGPARAAAYCLDKYSAQSSYAAWTTQPVKYRVSTTLTDTALLAAIDKAFQTWGSVQCSTLKFSKDAQFAMASAPFDKSTGHVNIYWVTKASELPTGMDSKYYFFHYKHFDAKGQLVGASMAVNGMTYNWSATGGDAATFDLQNVLTHYIGKVVGLTDSKTKGAVMFPDVTFGQTSKQTLTADDIAGLQYLYLATGCPKPTPPDSSGCSTGGTTVADGGTSVADGGQATTDGGAPSTSDAGVLPVSEAGTAQPDAGAGGVYYDLGGGGGGGQCSSSSQCAADEVCSAEGTCVKVGAGSSDGDSGCNIAPLSGPPSAALWALLCLGLCALLLRRRRS